MAFTPVAPADLLQDDAGPDMFVCPPGAEICNDGCDNDGNGYKDADDPACTPQMLVTYTSTGDPATGTPMLWRLVLDNPPRVEEFDLNPVQPFAMANYNKAFSALTFVVYASGELDTLLAGSGLAPILTTPTFRPRDLCTFNDELIVLEPRSTPLTSTLHRMKADGVTEILPAVTMAGVASACASDGDQLYVAFYQIPTHSFIEVFTKGGANGPVDTGNAISMPQSIVDSCCDRLLDFAYIKKGGMFIGLFANGEGGSIGDQLLSGSLMAPFAFDGGVGPSIDAGVWSGVGEFLP